MKALEAIVFLPFNWLGLFIGAAFFAVVFPKRTLGAAGWLAALCANVPTLIFLSRNENDHAGMVDFMTVLGFGGFGVGALAGMIFRTFRDRKNIHGLDGG
jgi:apolipoprotein N-acyltransferase